MAKNIVILILAILAIGAGYAAWTYQDKLEQREEHENSLQENVAGLQAEKSELETSLNSVETELADARQALQDQVSELRSTLEAKEEEVGSLTGQYESQQEQLSEFQQKAQSLETAAEDYEERIRSLQETLSEKDDMIETLNTQLEKLQSDFSAAKEQMGQLQGQPAGTANPAEGQGATQEEQSGAAQTDSQVPVAINSKSAGIFSSNKIVEVENKTDTSLAVTVTHTRADTNEADSKEITLPANGQAELGRDDWKIKSGDRLAFRHRDYSAAEFTVP